MSTLFLLMSVPTALLCGMCYIDSMLLRARTKAYLEKQAVYGKYTK